MREFVKLAVLISALCCGPCVLAKGLPEGDEQITTESIVFDNEQELYNDATEVTTIQSEVSSATRSPFVRVAGTTFGDCVCGQRRKTFELNKAADEAGRSGGAGRSIPSKEVYPLIIPAIPAEEREFPWLVAIQKKKWDGRYSVVCSGSVVNSRYVVTAAHCISTQNPSRLRLVFNAHNVSHTSAEDVEIRKIQKVIIHPGWNQENVDNDIGLIELNKPIDFANTDVRPICLPFNTSHEAFDGRNGTVAGWGYVRPAGPNSMVLNKISVPILSQKACIDDTIYQDKILDSMICAGYDEGGIDACTNDSGGPLIVEDGFLSKLVGIVSWGHGCARPKSPGVYTRVTRYVDWIVSNSLNSEWCL